MTQNIKPEPGEILVRLTRTSNPYLTDRLPLVGYLRVGETDPNGRISWGTFIERHPETPSARVEVRDIEFLVLDERQTARAERIFPVRSRRLSADHLLAFVSVAGKGASGTYSFVYLISGLNGGLALEMRTPDGETIIESISPADLVAPWLTAMVNDYERTKEN